MAEDFIPLLGSDTDEDDNSATFSKQVSNNQAVRQFRNQQSRYFDPPKPPCPICGGVQHRACECPGLTKRVQAKDTDQKRFRFDGCLGLPTKRFQPNRNDQLDSLNSHISKSRKIKNVKFEILRHGDTGYNSAESDGSDHLASETADKISPFVMLNKFFHDPPEDSTVTRACYYCQSLTHLARKCPIIKERAQSYLDDDDSSSSDRDERYFMDSSATTCTSDSDDSEFTNKLRQNASKSSSGSIKVTNVIGANRGLSRVSLNEDLKQTFDGEDTDQDLVVLKPRKNALSTFLQKCKPNFDFKKANGQPRTRKRPRETREEYEERVHGRPKKRPALASLYEPEVIELDSTSDSEIEIIDAAHGFSNPNYRSSRRIAHRQDSDQDDDWHVDIEDLIAQSSFKDHYDRKRLKCIHCGIYTDHRSADCWRTDKKPPACLVCAGNDHQESRCKERVCSTCYQRGHPGDRCGQSFPTDVCSTCKLRGHIEDFCTHSWRLHRYYTELDDDHQDNPNSTPVVINRDCSCSMCGERGHFAFECGQYLSLSNLRSPWWPSSVLIEPTDRMFNRAGKKVSTSQLVQNVLKANMFAAATGLAAKSRRNKKINRKIKTRPPAALGAPASTSSPTTIPLLTPSSPLQSKKASANHFALSPPTPSSTSTELSELIPLQQSKPGRKTKARLRQALTTAAKMSGAIGAYWDRGRTSKGYNQLINEHFEEQDRLAKLVSKTKSKKKKKSKKLSIKKLLNSKKSCKGSKKKKQSKC